MKGLFYATARLHRVVLEEGQFNEKSHAENAEKKCHSARLILSGHSKLDLESPDEDHYSIGLVRMMRGFRIKSRMTRFLIGGFRIESRITGADEENPCRE